MNQAFVGPPMTLGNMRENGHTPRLGAPRAA